MPEIRYEWSTARQHCCASLCLEMTPIGLKMASERSTAQEVHSGVSHQVLFKLSGLETACCTPEIQYERSTARRHPCVSLCLEMTLMGPKRASERSTAQEVHSYVSHQVVVKSSRLKTGCCMPEIRYKRSIAQRHLCASLCLEMPPNGLRTALERSTAPEMHS